MAALLSELQRTAAAISSDLTSRKIRHFISGSLALAMHARPRMTYVIDLVVSVPSLRLPEVFAVARDHGFAGDDRELITAIRTKSFAQLRACALTLDVIVPVLPFHVEIFERAIRVPMAGIEVPVATAEDLFVVKTLWFRPKDVADLHVLAAIGDGFDRTYVRAKLREILPPDDPRLVQVERILAV